MKDGGPAFPGQFPDNGMTLRDYFAAAAITGSMEGLYKGVTLSELVQNAYEVADAMLEKR